MQHPVPAGRQRQTLKQYGRSHVVTNMRWWLHAKKGAGYRRTGQTASGSLSPWPEYFPEAPNVNVKVVKGTRTPG
jgi:hypothetical protein